jgi:hypothetical protein
MVRLKGRGYLFGYLVMLGIVGLGISVSWLGPVVFHPEPGVGSVSSAVAGIVREPAAESWVDHYIGAALKIGIAVGVPVSWSVCVWAGIRAIRHPQEP